MIDTYLMPKNNETEEAGFDISRYTDYDFVRSRLIYKLINYRSNRDKLKSQPHRRFLNLAISYCCAFKTPIGENANITVTCDHLKYWNVTEEELYRVASKNTPERLGGRIEPLASALKRMAATGPADEFDGQEMYICTNMEFFYGSSTILYEGFLKKFASGLGCSLIILPSSVHEAILLPDRGESDYKGLEELVAYVNKTEVSPQEYLSDNIYIYDLEEDLIKMNI